MPVEIRSASVPPQAETALVVDRGELVAFGLRGRSQLGPLSIDVGPLGVALRLGRRAARPPCFGWAQLHGGRSANSAGSVIADLVPW